MNLTQTSQFSQKRVEPQNLPKLLGEKVIQTRVNKKKTRMKNDNIPIKYFDKDLIV